MQTFHEIKQEPPPGLFSSLLQHWGFGLLGNLEAQSIPPTNETFPLESSANVGLQSNLVFPAASPGTRLKALKTKHFAIASKAQRVERSLQALNKPLGVNISPTEWALVAELTEEDED